jgi:hypothetical protein
MKKLPEMLKVKIRSEDFVSVLADQPEYAEWVAHVSRDATPKGCKILCSLFDIGPHDLKHAIYFELVKRANALA